MKPTRIVFALMGCLAFAGESWGQPGLPGGYAAAALESKECLAAARFAVQEGVKAGEKGKGASPGKAELVKLVSAQQQVVAGMNYRLRLRVKMEGKEREAEAEVWWQAWRKPDPYRLMKWAWK